MREGRARTGRNEMDRTNESRGQPLRALLLHGDAAALRALSRSLESRSFAVLSAGDGDRGVELLVDALLSLDVVVLDADLPLRDARAFARLVRGAGGEHDLALVVVAREPDPELRHALLALGVDAVLEASAGSDAAAEAALAAVVARGTRILLPEEPNLGAEPTPARTPLAARLGLPLAGGWSLSPAW
jgi:CheY-like chemotaxis protein